MARPLRIEFPGALYHATSRGDGFEDIYMDDADRLAFLDALGAVCQRYSWQLCAYCLMTRHYHLVVETPEGTLSRGMRQLNGVYTQRFNKAHRRVGHAFQGRYEAILVEKDAHFLELARYVVLNPVRAGIVAAAGDWFWSSDRATAGDAKAPPWLCPQRVRRTLLPSRPRRWSATVGLSRKGRASRHPGGSSGSRSFSARNSSLRPCNGGLAPERDLAEVPRAQRPPPPKPLSEYVQGFPARDAAIVAAYASGGYTLKEIGNHFGLHYSRVSRIAGRLGVAKDKTPKRFLNAPGCTNPASVASLGGWKGQKTRPDPRDDWKGQNTRPDPATWARPLNGVAAIRPGWHHHAVAFCCQATVGVRGERARE